MEDKVIICDPGSALHLQGGGLGYLKISEQFFSKEEIRNALNRYFTILEKRKIDYGQPDIITLLIRSDFFTEHSSVLNYEAEFVRENGEINLLRLSNQFGLVYHR